MRNSNIITAANIIETLESQGYTYHHKALSRGYWCKGYSHALPYVGRFGEGYEVHQANCEGSVSNRYHYVIYMIKTA